MNDDEENPCLKILEEHCKPCTPQWYEKHIGCKGCGFFDEMTGPKT